MTRLLFLVGGVAFSAITCAAFAFPTAGQAQNSGAADIANAPSCGVFPVGSAPYLCICAPGLGNYSVWGSGPYTADSNICTAARHAGVIPMEGGAVLSVEAPGQGSYLGTTQNGVSTLSYGAYGNSFDVKWASAASAVAMPSCGKMPDNLKILQCVCEANRPASSNIWGNGPYTADSDICGAARHSGVIGDQGGQVTVLRLQGLDRYWGSTSNGVTSSGWASFGSSITLNRN